MLTPVRPHQNTCIMRSRISGILLLAASCLGILFMAACSGGGSNANNPTLTSISVTPATATLSNGGTQQYTATGTYSNNTQQDITGTVTWSSSTTTVASINSAGLATAAASGSGMTTITATSGSVSGTATLTVQAQLQLDHGDAGDGVDSCWRHAAIHRYRQFLRRHTAEHHLQRDLEFIRNYGCHHQ